MLLSEARPRPYRTTRSERDGKFADVYDKLDAAYQNYQLNDRYTLTVHNWTTNYSSLKNGRETILIRDLVDTYQKSNRDFIQLYYAYNKGSVAIAFYYIIDAQITSKLWKKFRKYFEGGVIDGIPLHNLFPELKDILDNNSKLFVNTRDVDGYTTIRIVLGFVNYDKLDFNTQMSARLSQLDSIIEKIKSRVSEKELEARAYKTLSNMLKACASAPDPDTFDDE